MAYAEQVFLTAEWRDLAMLNYEVDSRLLNPYVPRGTLLDSFQGRTYVSLVGFRFCRTRLFGFVPIPFHSDFEEVNLRFYVRRSEGGEVRRGVVFIAEIVPRRAIATVARLVYGESYVRLPMAHRVSAGKSNREVQYQWRLNRQWCTLSAQALGVPAQPPPGSFEQFITEHYWGYSTQPDGGCIEYHVSHDPWPVWTNAAAKFEGDASALYGAALGNVLQRRPESAFIATGSPVRVFKGRRIS